MFNLILLREGLRMFRRAQSVKKHGIHEYKGNAQEICYQIINDCWNGRYFQTSTGHFNQFWTRDFGWCTESLLNLGYREQVTKTLEYALKIFKTHGKITTTISPDDIPFDFPIYAVDSVPYLIRSLQIAQQEPLIKGYKDFLNSEIRRFYARVIDEKTGLVKKGHFSSIKDHAIRTSSCYDNVMVAMLNEELKKIRILENPLVKYDLEHKIKELFWKKTHFTDDLSGNESITGDANLFPFWLGIFNQKDMLNSAIRIIQEADLDKPLPLRYFNKESVTHKMHVAELFAYGYERNTVWMHMGPLYIKVVSKVNKKLADEYLSKYTGNIERYHNYLEVFNKNGTPFKSLFYHADEGMLWASIYLEQVTI